MADYRVIETESFLEDLAALPAVQREGLLVKLKEYVYPLLRRSPRRHPQTRLLRGYSPDTWRWRMGDWRAFYQIDDERRVVLMVSLALRRDAYRR